MSSGGVRDEPRAATPGAARDQNNVSPLDHGSGAQQDQQAAEQNGNVSTFEEGEDNVAEKGGAGTAVALSKREKVKRHCWRFKWWYVVAVVIFLAIILPIM